MRKKLAKIGAVVAVAGMAQTGSNELFPGWAVPRPPHMKGTEGGEQRVS